MVKDGTSATSIQIPCDFLTARFILSFDCEGKWGVADHLDRTIHSALGDASLRTAYGEILALLDEYALPATFAFVGCFAESSVGLKSHVDWLRKFQSIAPKYIGPVLRDLFEGSGEGWHGDWAVDAVSEAPVGHEIALHGVTHVPWPDLGQAGARDEMRFLTEMATPVRYARTFIFPRNEVAHQEVLAAAGVEAYRVAPRRRSRFASLMSEFNIFCAPEADQKPEHGLVTIPGGYFINWQSGARKLVPIDVTLERARRLFEKAESNDSIVHYWLHPENLSTAASTLEVLRGIVELAARWRDAGRCEVLTQLQYARSRQ